MTEPPDRTFERLHGERGEALALARAIGDRCRELGRGVVVVSACLLGQAVRYDGGDKRDDEVLARIAEARREGRLLPLCPEILAGFACPRPAMHFERGHGGTVDARAVDSTGRDVTPQLANGASRALELVGAAGASVQRAILKERSPSCGARAIHGAGGPGPGLGFFAAGLVRAGAPVEDERGIAALHLPVLKS